MLGCQPKFPLPQGLNNYKAKHHSVDWCSSSQSAKTCTRTGKSPPQWDPMAHDLSSPGHPRRTFPRPISCPSSLTLPRFRFALPAIASPMLGRRTFLAPYSPGRGSNPMRRQRHPVFFSAPLLSSSTRYVCQDSMRGRGSPCPACPAISPFGGRVDCRRPSSFGRKFDHPPEPPPLSHPRGGQERPCLRSRHSVVAWFAAHQHSSSSTRPLFPPCLRLESALAVRRGLWWFPLSPPVGSKIFLLEQQKRPLFGSLCDVSLVCSAGNYK